MNSFSQPRYVAQCAVLFTTLLVCLVPSVLAQPQNVLYIIADDLGVDYTEVYQEGTDYPSTPNIATSPIYPRECTTCT